MVNSSVTRALRLVSAFFVGMATLSEETRHGNSLHVVALQRRACRAAVVATVVRRNRERNGGGYRSSGTRQREANRREESRKLAASQERMHQDRLRWTAERADAVQKWGAERVDGALVAAAANDGQKLAEFLRGVPVAEWVSWRTAGNPDVQRIFSSCGNI